MSLEAKKIDVVQFILSIDDEKILDYIRANLLNVFSNPHLLEEDKDIYKYATTIEPTLDLEKIAAEQNYKELEEEEMLKLIQEADIQEPLEKLLDMI